MIQRCEKQLDVFNITLMRQQAEIAVCFVILCLCFILLKTMYIVENFLYRNKKTNIFCCRVEYKIQLPCIISCWITTCWGCFFLKHGVAVHCRLNQETWLAVQAKREGIKKKEEQSGGGWFSGWFRHGTQATTEKQTVGKLFWLLSCALLVVGIAFLLIVAI